MEGTGHNCSFSKGKSKSRPSTKHVRREEYVKSEGKVVNILVPIE